jgi:hypothetical protein
MQKHDLLWTLRKRFWNWIATFKFRSSKPVVIPLPHDEGRKLQAVSLASQYPNIPISNILVADHVPQDEAEPAKYYFYLFQVALYRFFSPMQPALRPIDKNPQTAINEAYTSSHRRLFPAPEMPAEYRDGLDLGYLAVAGPYACYLEKAEYGYQWDLRGLGNFEHHAELRSLGARVLFRVNNLNRLEATQIDCEIGSCTPADNQWDLAQQIALCAATTHVSLVRHFNYVHLAAGAPFAIATRNNLPAAHPLRRLLWPHMFGTQHSNRLNTTGLLPKGGDFETTFSFTHEGMCKLLAISYNEFDFLMLDPEGDAERRGIKDSAFEMPALENRKAVFDVMHAHAHRYLELYYDSDERLRDDVNFRKWIDELDRLVPNGVLRTLGDEITLPSAARLIASLIYLAAVEHELLGTGLWNYQLWTHVQPVRVYRSGQREPHDVYQRLVNANFNLNVRRKQLMDDFSYLAVDERGAAAFRSFRN